MSAENNQNAVSTVSENTSVVVYQESLERAHARAVRCLIWKLDHRLIPFLVVLELSSFINRISIGHAKLDDLQNALHLSTAEDNWAISLFFLAYLIFAIPSSLLLRIFGPTRYLSLSMIAWGSITIGMAFVKNARELLVIRFLLGVAEAGFFPGIIIYFSLWYCKHEQTMRMAIFFGAAIFSGAFGGILAYGISQLEGVRGLHGWQWIFILEGLPIIPLGFVTYFFLGNIPDTVQWLNNCEKQILTNMLRDDAGVSNSEPSSSTRLSWRQVGYVFVDWRIYLYVVIAIANLAVIKCLIVYLPRLVQGMGYTKAKAELMSSPPYVLACIFTLLGGFSSSYKNDHGYHLAVFSIVSVIGFILMATLIKKSTAAVYVGTCIACCGTFSAFPILLSWLTNNVGGHTKRAMSVGFLMGIGQIGGVIVPQVYRDIDGPDFRRGHIICGAFMIIAFLVTIVLRFTLKKENKRRDGLTATEREKEAQTKEPCDWHPEIRYVL